MPRSDHALTQREHDAHRGIATTAIRLGMALISDDEVFRTMPGLVVESRSR
jgi:predicted nucleic acid-binding protein